jgi:5'-phosphate synthase pdxT subunit
MVTIGVLALQGCVDPHRPHIEALGARFKPVRYAGDFDDIAGLILPGGESSTMLKLIETYQLEESLCQALHRIPFWGICAGAILLAKTVEPSPQKSFKMLDVTVLRNAYGRQGDSFSHVIEGYPVSFIRAPKIKDVGPSLTIRHELEGFPTWVEANTHMATTFHPELTPQYPSPFHQIFWEKICPRVVISDNEES